MDLNSILSGLDLPWATTPLDSPVDPEADAQFHQWLAEGRNAEMSYMANYPDIRRDPRMLLDSAQTLIVVAFPYYTDEKINLPISLYARGRDYHEVVRERLSEIAALLPGQTRVCVDTTPLRERYWAARAGLGFIGRNNQLIIPGLGSYFFLGFILSTEPVESGQWRVDSGQCGDCDLCVRVCPGQCLSTDGRALDARRCLSYLTIEHRGPLPTPSLRHSSTLYGCDICQRVCPHNSRPIPTPIADFHPSAELAALTADDVARLTPARFNKLFKHSAIKRTKLAGLQRNLNCLNNTQSSIPPSPSSTEESTNQHRQC
ncbi:MAG: tRNA epoxyqueuosine(34) reductase QueG [Bacteroides sp.]|nr:tRNA epoxyqueuosine(34) reductase QueG [Bacteroides sp.]MCM1379201.1 tRNA epoxyqueuosine(34) reductase QueG [Bacteroides sp.]MCM1445150.1 tRNA epoxyqueuosine(34) reductase QueG [Prevotella sp.]